MYNIMFTSEQDWGFKLAHIDINTSKYVDEFPMFFGYISSKFPLGFEIPVLLLRNTMSHYWDKHKAKKN